jgi:RNA polymerase sigma-70 factor (ECF subfamily)
MSAPAPRRPIEASGPDAQSRQDDLYASAITEFGPALSRLAAACERDRSLQQDLLQDIHVAVWRSFATFRNQCSLRTWVYRVAHNTAASFARRHRKFRREQLVSLEELDAQPWPERHDSSVERGYDEAAITERLRELIRQLKPIDRDVILLYLEGMDATSIGDILGLSADNVAQKVHRTKKVLRSRSAGLQARSRRAGLSGPPHSGDRHDFKR